MMITVLQLKFSTNPNGKLFPDAFGDIRPADYEKFMAGNIIEIWFNKQCLGKAEVIGFKEFTFSRLTDTLAQMNCGRGAAYQAKLLKNFYPSLENDSSLMHIVFRWSIRYMAVQEPFMRDWWQLKRDQFPQNEIQFDQIDAG